MRSITFALVIMSMIPGAALAVVGAHNADNLDGWSGSFSLPVLLAGIALFWWLSKK